MKTNHSAARVRRPSPRFCLSGLLLLALLVMPLAAHAQGSSISKVSSLIAIVSGGYSFSHGEPGAKKTLAGVAAGTGIAVLAVNVLTWLWGV